MNDISNDYEHALPRARAMPTWALRRRERRSSLHARRRTPSRAELARLLAARAVLRERERR